MKNIIVALTLIFTLGINAQTKTTTTPREVPTVKPSPEMSAKKQVNLVNTVAPIDSKTQVALESVLTSKYEVIYNTKNLSTERKDALSKSIASQIETVLDKKTFEIIKNDQTLYESLIN